MMLYTCFTSCQAQGQRVCYDYNQVSRVWKFPFSALHQFKVALGGYYILLLVLLNGHQLKIGSCSAAMFIGYCCSAFGLLWTGSPEEYLTYVS